VPDVVVALPDELRSEFKEPLGDLYTDAETLLDAVDGPLIAVGDVVTYHLREAGRAPDVAVVDERTEREAVDDDVRAAVTVPDPVEVANPAATLTADLLVALRDAIDADEPTTILVDGEEDLATLPAVLAAPDGASVVYGQPGEGMVLVTVTDAVRGEFDALVDRLDGDPDRLRALCSAA
jgi:uncharacterized protein (UPF0218 family)